MWHSGKCRTAQTYVHGVSPLAGCGVSSHGRPRVTLLAASVMDNKARQLIVVSSPTERRKGDIATFTAYARNGAHARWRRVFGGWPAETGYGDLRRDRREGMGRHRSAYSDLARRSMEICRIPADFTTPITI